MIHLPRANEDGFSSAPSMTRYADPIESAYRVIDEAASRYGLQDAWLVLHPPGLSAQVFRHRGGHPPTGGDVQRLAERPTGLYGEPAIEPAVGMLLGEVCEAAFAARAAAVDALVDGSTGLLTRKAVEASLARVAACGARHRWSTTAVLVTTAGGEPGDTTGDTWRALAAAMDQALRSGDEAGVVSPGTALALLGNAGADAVRPFLARVRAALSARGAGDVDLLAATVTTPQDSVDPSELWRLLTERLAQLGADAPPPPAENALELELRLLPSVAYVGESQNGNGPTLTVVALGAGSAESDVDTTVRRHAPNLVVHLETAPPPEGGAPRCESGESGEPAVGHANGNGDNAGDGANAGPAGHGNGTSAAGRADPGVPGGPPPAVPVAAAGTIVGGNHSPRVNLIGASFDSNAGVSEVTVALGAARGTGRAPAAALIGAAQATLVALGAVGRAVPFYLVHAERSRTIPGEPVVVVLAPRSAVEPAGSPSDRSTDLGGGAAERIGVAHGETDAETASRAVLAALNRFLAGPHRAG